MGEGPRSVSLPSTRHHYQPGQVFSPPNADGGLPWAGDREPLFEGFSFPGEGFDPASYRISVLQAAKCHVLALPVGLPVVSVPPCPRGSTSHAVSVVDPPRPMGLC